MLYEWLKKIYWLYAFGLSLIFSMQPTFSSLQKQITNFYRAQKHLRYFVRSIALGFEKFVEEENIKQLKYKNAFIDGQYLRI